MNDQIYALATPPLNSSLALIRLSGSKLRPFLIKFFSKSKQVKNRQAVYGSLVYKNKIIDDVILIFYQAPHSFTGEDMIEITCHGNQLIIQRIYQLFNSLGFRLAAPGEFSKRAFLNGKIDLTKAEAINQILVAKSEWHLETALGQMHGSMLGYINQIRELIIQLKADLEASIDFIEEDLEFISHKDSLKLAKKSRDLLNKFWEQLKLGEKISQGIEVVIVGKPNVGKSSLLNLLLNQERAIVTDTPGTTRDLIQETITINGFQLNLTDTAGIHKTRDVIEQKGIKLSYQQLEKAGLVLMVLDPTTGYQEADKEIIKTLATLPDKEIIFLVNKIDLASKKDLSQITKKLQKTYIPFSAKKAVGLEELKKKISLILKKVFVPHKTSFVADRRIINLTEKALLANEQVIDLIKNKSSVEIITFELQELINLLGEMTGEISPEDILDSIFSRFCIGK